MLDALNDALADAHPAIAQTQRMVTYGRDDEATAALSAACDLRVHLGRRRVGHAIRRHPLAPLARDVTFPDRSSFAALSVPGWAALRRGRAARRRGRGFANDAYWFDQAACASPRTLFWVGGAAAESAAARDEFVALLVDEVAARGWGVDAAMAVEKRVATYGLAADGAATEVRFATQRGGRGRPGRRATCRGGGSAPARSRSRPSLARRAGPADRAQGPDLLAVRLHRRRAGRLRPRPGRPRHRPDRPVRPAR